MASSDAPSHPDEVGASPLGAPASSPGGEKHDRPPGAPRTTGHRADGFARVSVRSESLPDEAAASLLGVSGSPLGNEAFARVSVHSQNSDYLALLARSQMSLLAGSQMSQTSSISSDFRGMLLNDMSDYTLDSLLSESIVRARQRQEDFRHSLDSCHMNLNGSMARAWQRQQEDSRLAASAVVGRQGRGNIAIKKRTKPTKMKEVDFDPAPDDDPQYRRKVSLEEGNKKRTKLMGDIETDCLALLAGSQRSRGSSISSDFRGMLLDGSSDSTLGDSYLLSESIIRARQRQEKFRNSLDSYHLDASLNRSRRQQQEDFKLAASAVSRDHNSSILLRKDSGQSIGSESSSSLSASLRSRRRDGRRVPLKKRSKLMMKEVNFDPPPDHKPQLTESMRNADFDPTPDDESGRPRETGREEDADVVQSLMTLGGGGAVARRAVTSPDVNEQTELTREVNCKGGAGHVDLDPAPDDALSDIAHHSFCDAEARQLKRLAASIERTGRSRRQLMARRGAADRSAAFFAGARDTLTDGLEESRRRLKMYTDSGEGATNDGAT